MDLSQRRWEEMKIFKDHLEAAKRVGLEVYFRTAPTMFLHLGPLPLSHPTFLSMTYPSGFFVPKYWWIRRFWIGENWGTASCWFEETTEYESSFSAAQLYLEGEKHVLLRLLRKAERIEMSTSTDKRGAMYDCDAAEKSSEITLGPISCGRYLVSDSTIHKACPSWPPKYQERSRKNNRSKSEDLFDRYGVVEADDERKKEVVSQLRQSTVLPAKHGPSGEM
jgi:hypothetical protein